jgi:hypothetical protein
MSFKTQIEIENKRTEQNKGQSKPNNNKTMEN